MPLLDVSATSVSAMSRTSKSHFWKANLQADYRWGAELSQCDTARYTVVIIACTKNVAMQVLGEQNAVALPRNSVRYKNQLFAADNLSILRESIGTETIDLVYLDPPFNSKQDYNVIFNERSGRKSTSQKLVFEDTWTWTPHAEELCRTLAESGGRLSDAIRALRTFLGNSDMMAYLVMMAPRLRELQRVLKPTGSIYLHCDPTASHYLKMLMDAVFGPTNFRNEIIWKRTTAHSSSKRYGPVHDVLLYYSKTGTYTWNQQYLPYSDQYLAAKYYHEDESGRRYTLSDLSAAGVRHGSSGKSWHGIDPTARGYHWKFTIDNLERLDKEGRIYWPTKGGVPRYKRYLDEVKGVVIQDIWDDILPVNSQAQERLGYPTQKPVALLERLVRASSNLGDVVLDPFCGCGTAIEAAQALGRHWVGIDVTLLATAVIKTRLLKFGNGIFKTIKIMGEPVNIAEAEALAAEDKFRFQWWAVGRLGAPPIEEKKGRDRGVDGRIYFHDDAGPAKHIVISVKAGEHVGPAVVRELRGVIERDRASMGILVTVKQKTAEMLREASTAGMYKSVNGNLRLRTCLVIRP